MCCATFRGCLIGSIVPDTVDDLDHRACNRAMQRCQRESDECWTLLSFRKEDACPDGGVASHRAVGRDDLFVFGKQGVQQRLAAADFVLSAACSRYQQFLR